MRTELLSPAGNKEAFLSAIHHGANAIYIGGLQYGARSQAQNFSLEEIIELIKYAHLMDVKVYVTVNTLIKDDEFMDAVKFVGELYKNNVDAIIIQDIGLATYLLKVYPDIVLHASTQMNIHTVEQAKFIKSLGFKRVILARECTLEVIRKIKQEVDIEVEIFVHGALCMSYSGNCLMSSVIGKRSGNRGKCAQPCRLPYSLGENDKPSYLLSPKDLMSLDNLEDILDTKVDSLKIEGRMKRSEYVGLVTEIYSNAINCYYSHKTYDKDKALLELKEMFNREFTKGYMFRVNNKDFTNTKFSNHIGIKLGNVIKTDRNYVYVKLENELENGDSIRISGRISDAVTVSEMYINNALVKHAKAGDTVKIRCHKELVKGAVVLKTTTIKLMNRLNKYEEKKIDITGKCFVRDKKLVLQVKCGNTEVEEESTQDVEFSDNDNFKTRLYEQLQKTHSTIYKFTKLVVDVKNIFLPISIVNDLRRRTLDKLSEERLKFKEKRVVEYEVPELNIEEEDFKLLVKVDSLEQYLAAREIYDGFIMTENRELIEKYKNDTNLKFINPRIEVKKPLDGGVQNYNLLGNNHLFTGVYCNVFNSYTLAFYHKLGFKKVGLSVELSSSEQEKLIKEFINRYHVKPNTYILAYGRYELMVMKHCVVNKRLGLDHLGCNKCKEKQYYLKDRLGFDFPLLRAEGCNMKLLNSKVLCLIRNIDEIRNNGVNGVLLDFTVESPDQVKNVIENFQKSINSDNYTLNIEDVTYGHFNEGVL